MQSKSTSKLVGISVVLGAFFLNAVSFSSAANLPAESKISEVTVYPGSARVTRQANIDLSVGEHSIVFENIKPQLDENSLTVTGKGTAQVKIFGAYIKSEYSKETADERVKELEALIESLSDQIQMEGNNNEILSKELEYLDSIKLFSGQQIPKDLVTSMPSVENLEGVRGFLMERYGDVNKRKEAIAVKIRELNKEKEVARRKLNELRSFGSQQQRLLVVDLECAKAGKFALDVSYLVRGANWRSVYDARADLNKAEVELTSFGMIKQTTGEDWENVQLTLSTAQPTVSGRMPYVEPWILNPIQPRAREAMAPAMMPMKGMAMMKDEIGGQYEPYYMSVGESASVPLEQEADLAYSQTEQKGVSVVFKIVRPVTIKSDGSDNRYPISAQVLKANFEYSSYPRMVPFAYLGSRVVNSKDLQLLAGEVNLFLEGDYIGKSNVDNIGPGEEFSLYLGIDENVKVKREQISRKVDDVLIGGIKSPNRTTTFEYKLTVENYKNKNINVHLFEAMPVSENERIKVKVSDVSLKPNDKDWKDRAGIYRWEFTLKPEEKREIFYSFSVDHPREMNIPGI
ncbi:MAG: mucoidy inhibitor MuiA family protein [Candidatus Omnitrophica bacterium]|nr:mucoidy inhibitor MuiA family protein [Candidatus Omnitrophota bacterium]